MRHRCVGAIIVDGTSVLLCHRAADREWFPNVWDFPGGHVETNETSAQALARELLEELGIIAILPPTSMCVIESDAHSMTLEIWRVDAWEGTATNRCRDEHDRIGWFKLDEVSRLVLADEAYRPLFTCAVGSPTR